MAKFLSRVVVGAVVSSPAIVILTGGPSNAFELLMLSIICTAGIGLVFWIPVWWVVGLTVLNLIGLIAGGRAEQTSMDEKEKGKPTTQAYLALTVYISRAISSGMDPDEMTQRLQANGWQKSEIDSVYQKLIAGGDGQGP